MSPVRHQISGTELSFQLRDEMQRVRQELSSASGRVARTLVKMGSLRVTLVGISAGGTLAEHTSPGPVSIQVLDGAMEVATESKKWPLAAGDVLTLDAGVAHAVSSSGGSLFLLTVAAPASERSADTRGT
ncbi:MAG TPA: cupin domain-containing protein [Gemmatimonadaceae bacterium]|jgi:quercetin dioxygenase-like cupin family protein|nr:cupin domain-containing protein [Gemmatimonadaceae bacterium]